MRSVFFLLFILTFSLVAGEQFIADFEGKVGKEDAGASLSVDVDDEGNILSLLIDGYDGVEKKISLKELKSGKPVVGLNKLKMDLLIFEGVNFSEKGGEIKLKYLEKKEEQRKIQSLKKKIAKTKDLLRIEQETKKRKNLIGM